MFTKTARWLRTHRDLRMATPEHKVVLCPMCNATVDVLYGNHKARRLVLEPCGHSLRTDYARTWIEGWA